MHSQYIHKFLIEITYNKAGELYYKEGLYETNIIDFYRFLRDDRSQCL